VATRVAASASGSTGESSGAPHTIVSVLRRPAASDDDGWNLFWAESEYAQSILCSALGDGEGCVTALRRSLEALPTYAPAILTLGSVEYQLDRAEEGRRLFLSLLDLPDDTEDLVEIIDKAGDFLISIGAYADGLDLYRAATARFPRVSVFHQGLGCCAGHEGLHAEALIAAEAALALAPSNQELVNDLGYSLYLVGRLEEARTVLKRAAAMDDAEELAAGNLQVCLDALAARTA